jgi:hypothetical protein
LRRPATRLRRPLSILSTPRPGPPWRCPPSQPLDTCNRLLKVNVPRRAG